MIRVLTALFLLLALPLAAQTFAPAPPEDLATAGRDIPPAEWKDRVEGRTVWYFLDDGLWGREYYHPGAGYVTFQFRDGQCLQAEWSHADNIYCFDFKYGPPHCFRHVEHDGRIWVLPADGGTPQAVMFIDKTLPDCGPPPSA